RPLASWGCIPHICDVVRFPRAIGARRCSHCGVALVGFALTLPLLAILVFGTVDLGRAYLTWVRVKNAAREGAAYAQTHPYQQTKAQCPDPDNVTAGRCRNAPCATGEHLYYDAEGS
ncbi:MAG: hypothetical protein C4346_19745, partial [Chloroflexota bacterium]